MKKIFTLLTIHLFFYSFIYAAAPTTSSSGLTFSNIDGTRFNYTITTPGNGARRIVVMREGSPVTGLPVNGIDYVHNALFGTSGTEFSVAGEYVINDGNISSGLVTGLNPNTTYYLAVFEYNGTGTGTEYRMVACTGSTMTATAPTTQTGGFSFSSVTGTSMTVNWTDGDGARTLVIAKKGSVPTATPANLATYLANASFGNGAQIAANEFVVYFGTANTFGLSNLEPNATYYFAFFECNGTSSPVYLTPAAITSRTTNAGPTTAPGNPTYSSIEGNSYIMTFNKGTGSKFLVIAKQGAAPTFTPANSTTVYTGNTAFGSGQQVVSGEYVISTTNSNNISVTNLQPNTTYYFRVYGYDSDLSGYNYYLTGSFGASSGATASTPPNQATFTSFTLLTSTSVTINYARQTGATYTLIVVKAGSPVDANPADLTAYAASNVFTSGSQIGTGNYVVSGANGNIANITGLTQGVIYYFALFAYNGINAPVYKVPGATASVTTPATTPTTASSVPVTFDNIEGNSFRFNWTSGNGANRIIVAKQGSAPTFVPTNGNAYTANASFGSSTNLGGGQYVVYNGSGNTVTLTNLVKNTTYYFVVYEYNGTGANTKYLTATSLSANSSTATTPATGSTNASAILPTATSMKLDWTSGSGSKRLVVVKQGSAITGMPADLTAYAANAAFTSGSQLNAGEYAVYAINGNTVTVTGLTAGLTYYYSIFEFNGNTAPVYNTTNVLSGSVAPIPLPLSWVSFTANTTRFGVELSWITATEVNTDHFDVERSMNGIDYTTVGALGATGQTSLNHYSYTDTQVSGTVYYRIKQVDKDGQHTYSKVLRLQVAKIESRHKLYPNPATRTIYIGTTGKATVCIYDSKGQLIQVAELLKSDTVDVSALQPGVYMVVIKEADQSSTIQLLKQ